MEKFLSNLEKLVLNGVIACGDNSYGVPIMEKVSKAKCISIASLYITLSRLEERNFLESWEGEATPERGFRRKRYYKVTEAGKAALVG